MEVSSVQDHATHALIGGQQGRDFGISDDPAFFQILSKTLYKFPNLAVVRETLCNGWDAHIAAGLTDKPLEVTLTKDELIIRDFGSGIADEDMQPIYGVYGASTKKQDATVTGGFGLGCKAPFAYSEHFEVTSWHKGTKTIYNLSRSSAEVNGKPGIFPIASFPTTESGLQVRIPLNNCDQRDFGEYIRRIALLGEILVNLNGALLEVLPFSKANHGCIFLPMQAGLDRINVRYGNVVYPLDTEHLECSREIAEYLTHQLPHNYAVIFQVPANSVSIIPSREGLTYTENTVETINSVIPESFRNTIEGVPLVVRRKVRNAFRNKADESLLIPDGMANSLRFESRPGTDYGYDCQTIGNLTYRAKLDTAFSYRQHFEGELEARLRALRDVPGIDVDLVKSLHFAQIKSERVFTSPIFRRGASRLPIHWWYHAKYLSPVLEAFRKEGLNTRRLKKITHVSGHNGVSTTDPLFEKPDSAWGALPLLKKRAVLTFNHDAVINRAPQFPQIGGKSGRLKGALLYTVPRKYKGLAKLRQAFTDAGFDLIDLTVAQSWEDDSVIEPLAASTKRDVKEGLPVLSSLVTNESNETVDLPEDPATSDEITARLVQPKYVLKLPRGRVSVDLSGEGGIFGSEATPAIIALFGDETGVCINSTQMDKYIKEGSIDLLKHIETILMKKATGKRLRKLLSRDLWRAADLYLNAETLLRAASDCPELVRLFKAAEPKREDDQHIRQIIRSIPGSYDGRKLKQALELPAICPEMTKRISPLVDGRGNDVLCHWQVARFLKSGREDDRNFAIKLIKFVMKG